MMANLKRRKMLTKDEILDYLKEIKPKLQEDGITKLGLLVVLQGVISTIFQILTFL